MLGVFLAFTASLSLAGVAAITWSNQRPTSPTAVSPAIVNRPAVPEDRTVAWMAFARHGSIPASRPIPPTLWGEPLCLAHHAPLGFLNRLRAAVGRMVTAEQRPVPAPVAIGTAVVPAPAGDESPTERLPRPKTPDTWRLLGEQMPPWAVSWTGAWKALDVAGKPDPGPEYEAAVLSEAPTERLASVLVEPTYAEIADEKRRSDV